MRVVLVGAGGQLAHDLLRELSNFDTLAFARSDLELADAAQVMERIAAAKPTHVVNAAAYNLVDQAESDPEAAFAVNAFGVRNLAKACHQAGAVLLHFSTDYVFGRNATRETPYAETDLPGPVSVYGLSKLAGEHFVLAECPRSFVVRTCGLYGVKGSRGKGGNFVETMLKLAAANKPLTIVNDQTCTPSFTADVASAAVKLLPTDDFGVHHLTNSGSCTWFEFANEIFRQSNLTVDCSPITSAQFNAKARRPPYSVLSSKLEALPAWEDALSRYLKARTSKPSPLVGEGGEHQQAG